jgi:hypothetical protein
MEKLEGVLFFNENPQSAIFLEGFLKIEGKRINVVVFSNVSKEGKKYLKILPKKENTEKKN